MQGITSYRGSNRKSSQIPLSDYTEFVSNSIRSLFDEKAKDELKRLLKFLENSPMPIAILSYDMESTSGDIILDAFSSSIKEYGLNSMILRVTSKSSTKKQILQYINTSIQSSTVVYIECFEEWPQETLCFIFEYLIDQPFKVPFVVDISTDPRYLSQTLDASILQKVTVEQFFFPEFSSITADVLWGLTQKCNFPVLSEKIFIALAGCRSEARFLKILKSSLLKFFSEKKQNEGNGHVKGNDLNKGKERIRVFLNEEGLEEFINCKDQWIENLFNFIRIAETPPGEFPVKIEDLLVSIYRATGTECSVVTDFIGKFKSKEFEKFENLDEFMVGLCERFVLSQEDINFLRSDYLRIDGGFASTPNELEIKKCNKWKTVFLFPKLRSRVINNLVRLDEVVSKKLKIPEIFILDICDFIDSDLMNISLKLLNFSSFGLNGDMQILFKIIKGKQKDLELNEIFNEFCNNCTVHEGVQHLQSQFLNACNNLWTMGLLKQSKKKKKADIYYLEKNFFGRSNFYN